MPRRRRATASAWASRTSPASAPAPALPRRWSSTCRPTSRPVATSSSAVADAGNADPGDRRQRRLRAQRPGRRQDDHRHPTGSGGERIHRAVRAARGGTVAVTATVKNLAASPAQPRRPRRSSSISPTTDARRHATWSCRRPAPSPVLGPGAASAAVTTLAIPRPVTTGNKFLLARAEALDQIPEAQEGNNITARAIEIGDFADLQITAVAGPAAAGTGRPMTVSFTTRNAGVAPVGPVPREPVPGPRAESRAGARRRHRRRLQGLPRPRRRRQPRLDARRRSAGRASRRASYFLSAVADAGNAIPETGGNDSLALNGRVAAKTDHRDPAGSGGERAHRAGPRRARRHRRR